LRTVPPGTPLALFTLSTHLRLVQGFTTDIARMADAVLRLDVQAAAARLPITIRTHFPSG
ncbi:MAG TPA: hypothetical protein VF392_12820, partial [Terracidiphilus sp.]